MLVVGNKYRKIQVRGSDGKLRTLIDAVVLDSLQDAGEISYVIGAPPVAIPGSWIESHEEEEE